MVEFGNLINIYHLKDLREVKTVKKINLGLGLGLLNNKFVYFGILFYVFFKTFLI